MNAYLFMLIYFSVVIMRWWNDSGHQVLIWDMVDPAKKKSAEYHWSRSIILILVCAMSWLFLFKLSNEWLWSLLFVICVNVVGIVIYEFRYCYLAYGDWKFHKEWGWKIKLFGKIKTIAYPKWGYWILIAIINLIGVIFIGKHLADAISDRSKK